MRTFLTTTIAILALSACATLDSASSERIGEARLSFANGVPAGTAQLLTDGQRVWLAMAATGLEPGEHGFHLHTTGSCKAPDFKSAGGHLNPADKKHGSLNPQGKHLGDLPNLVVGASRSATSDAEIGADTASLRKILFDADGTAVVIHAGPDDYRSDPAGDAGSRVACGIIEEAN